MSKNNCCKICGRLDFDDNGIYLICRICGEKKRKYRFPWLEIFGVVLFALGGIFAEIIGALIRVYKPDVHSPNFNTFTSNAFLDAIHNKFETYSISKGFYNSLDFLMIKIQKQLFWLDPFFTILGILLFLIAAFLVKKVFDASRKIIV